MQQVHKDCPEVVKALSFEAKSKERKKELDRIRLLGNFMHNNKVLEKNKGELKVVRRPPPNVEGNPLEYLPCLYCYGFLHKAELYRHVHTCEFASEGKEVHPRRLRYNCSLLLSTNNAFKNCNKDLADYVLPRMKSDNISLVARRDELILMYGAALLNKHGKNKANLVSQKMRELARLLVEVRNLCRLPSLQFMNAITPDKFDVFVTATKNVSGFDAREENHLSRYKSPSTSLKLGYALKKAAFIVRGWAIRSRDAATQKDVDDFLKLYDQDWSETITCNALDTLSFRKHNKQETLPLTEDLVKLRDYQLEQMEELTERLELYAQKEVWRSLACVCLARMIIFNKRRSGEASKLRVDVYKSKPNWKAGVNQEIEASLSPQERELQKR